MTRPAFQTEETGWKARLHLGFKEKKGKTILFRNHHRGPLTVQKPLYPEKDTCHCYILHPPGGIVGGDILTLETRLDENASALLTTPGATKFYRSIGKEALQVQNFYVNSSCLEWFPQDTIIFPGANARIETTVYLNRDAHFLGWEILCLGLPTQNKRFTSGSLLSKLSLYRENRPIFLDTIRIKKENDLNSTSGFRGFPVTGTFLATGVKKEMLQPLREHLIEPGNDQITGITLMEDILVGRYLGYSTFEARNVFEKLWSLLRLELIGRKPCPPRIWAT